MADTVTTQIIHDGYKSSIIKLTNLSDGTGEASVVKVNASSLSHSPKSLIIEKIFYNIEGMTVTLIWKGTTDSTIIHLTNNGYFDFSEFSGLTNNAIGANGDIALTTSRQLSGDSYSIILNLRKVY